VPYVAQIDSRPVSEMVSDAARQAVRVNDGAIRGRAVHRVEGDLLKQAPPTLGVDSHRWRGLRQFGLPDVDVLIGAKYFADHLLAGTPTVLRRPV
jgi:hypothetical protein